MGQVSKIGKRKYWELGNYKVNWVLNMLKQKGLKGNQASGDMG